MRIRALLRAGRELLAVLVDRTVGVAALAPALAPLAPHRCTSPLCLITILIAKGGAHLEPALVHVDVDVALGGEARADQRAGR